MAKDEDYIAPDTLLRQAQSLMKTISIAKPYAILEFGIDATIKS